MKMEFVRLTKGQTAGIKEMSEMATAILREHYDPIIGVTQNDYMLEKFQSVEAITAQLEEGYSYFFVKEKGENLGFMGFYPKEDYMYLSKLYLYKEQRGKGYAWDMLEFLKKQSVEAGLSAIELNVNKYNEGSIKAYEKLGFVRDRGEKNDIGQGYFMDDYVYRIEF